MDANRFDSLAKTLAQGMTRRRALKGLAGALAAAVVGGRGIEDVAAQDACPDGQYHDGSRCLCALTEEPPNRKTGECRCGRGTTECGGTCVNIDSDPNHCGACGAVCLGGECRKGECRCAWGQTLCGDVCADLQSDAGHCGACGVACPPGSTCGGDGVPGECGCVRETCESLGAGCGAYDDGCGGTIQCTTCPVGQTCVVDVCTLNNGQTCAAGTECLSEFCAGGVCCDAACEVECQDCATGTCLGTTGDACGTDGTCGGTCDAGSCGYPDSTLTCADPICSSENSATTYGCDGVGGCQPTVTDCGLYRCEDGACLTTCADDNGCVGAAYCDAGFCREDRTNGETCTVASQCLSGYCVAGVCCDGACDGLCESCASGTCAAAVGVPCGPEGVCQGACGSESLCVFPGVDVVCTEEQCVDGIETYASGCDGAGACVSYTKDCQPFHCDAAGRYCLNFCGGNGDCDDGYFCDVEQVCSPVKDVGESCAGNAECGNGFCFNGFCRNDNCTSNAQCPAGYHCGGSGGDGRCARDVAMTEPCAVDVDCGGGLACQETSGVDRCCPAAICPPCTYYDQTCTCVPIPNSDGRGCAADRVCCAGVCCAEGGACESGACTVTCRPAYGDTFGPPRGCDTVGDCCIDESIACSSVYVMQESSICCHELGGACTPGGPVAHIAAEECCDQHDPNAPSEEYVSPVGCGSEGVCGGKGARCDGFFEEYQCAFGRCCGATIDGEQTLFCCGADEVCRQWDGGCRKATGAVCGADAECDLNHICCEGRCLESSRDHCATCDDVCSPTEECAGQRCRRPMMEACGSHADCLSGFCYNGICCDGCGVACGKPQPDNTSCGDDHVCCGLTCRDVSSNPESCGSCTGTCPPGDSCMSGNCTCTESSQCTPDGFDVHPCNFSANPDRPGLCVATTEWTLACVVVNEGCLSDPCDSSDDCGENRICTSVDCCPTSHCISIH